MFNNDFIRFDLSKNTKFLYYIKNILYFISPSFYYVYKKRKILKRISQLDNKDYVMDRVNYYNKKNDNFILEQNFKTIKEFYFEKKKTYFFDLFSTLSLFPKKFKISYLFGDVIDIPSNPTFVKSRPICSDNENSIILKLNKVRHFIFVNDELDFKSKKDIAVWRGNVYQENRVRLLEKYFFNKYCDVGETNPQKEHEQWQKPRLSIKKQLEYKFILSLEGNDVASNLKWAMSSNSLVLMTKPRFETWFMEGLLKENFHYVLIKDDYSDLQEKIEYYINHTEEAIRIIRNANKYVEQFKDKNTEDIISYMVVDKYFKKSNQN